MKKIIFTLTFFGLIAGANAQFSNVWNQNYQHTTANSYSNESKKIAMDLAGNIFTLSDHTSNLDINGVAGGGTHHYSVINKYSTTGNLLQQKQIEVFDHLVSGFSTIGAFGLEVDASGNVYVGYCPWDTGWGTNYNVEVLKCDNNLNTIWRCLYTTPGDDHGIDMKVSSGEVYAIAKSTNGGNTLYYLLNFASQGASTTIYAFGPNENITSMALQPTTEDVYVTGYTKPGNVKTILMVGINTTTHTMKWSYSKSIGSPLADDYGTSITIGGDGNIYAAGVEEGSVLGNNIVVLKHGPKAGKMSWIGELHYDQTDKTPIVLAPGPNYVYVGAASEVGITLYKFNNSFQPPRGLIPYLYRPNPATTHMGVVDMTLNAMKISASEKIYITGGVAAIDVSGPNFNAYYLAKLNVIFGTTISLAFDVTQVGDLTESFEGIGLALDASKTDVYWLINSWQSGSSHQTEKVRLSDMDVASPLREGIISGSNSVHVSFYPNPASERLNISASENIISLQIINITGQVVKSLAPGSILVEISISDLKEGVYFCHYVTESGITGTQRLEIQ